ncbi:MAG TPA: GFA family protein [Myxococcaceae bacterium]|nr:GFA family protein [Myxococcaceae bacterium]
MADTETRRGGCHCGAVRYTVELERNPAALSCNCSMCGRAGTLLSFVPASRFHLEHGDDATTDYLFNRRHIHHLFCRTCGIKSFARGTDRDGQETIAVNVRCLDGFEAAQFRVTEFDGRSR